MMDQFKLTKQDYVPHITRLRPMATTSFVPADKSDASDIAMSKFCAAFQALKQLEASKCSTEQKEMRESCSSLKSLLLEAMQHHGVTCIPVTGRNGSVWYARIRERRKPVKVCPDALIHALKSISPSDIVTEREANPQATLPVLVESCLKKSIAKSGESSAAVEISKTAERSYAPSTQEPIPSIMENARQLHLHTSKLKLSRKASVEARKPLKAEQTRAEAQVASILQRRDPELASQRVLVRDGDGIDHEYILKRRSSMHRRRPTMRCALPIFRAAIEDECQKRQITHDASPFGLAVLQRHDCAILLQEKLSSELSKVAEPTERVTVGMRKVKPARPQALAGQAPRA